MLISPFYQALILDKQVGVSREGLSMKRLKEFPILLPPMEEQSRILRKVEKLMVLCDQLETQIKAKDTYSAQLLESSIHNALEEAA